MSRLGDAEMPLALADCSFDELIPDAGLTSTEAGKLSTTATSFSRVATLSLREPNQKLPATLLPDRLPPSHASSIIYAPTSTLIVARAIHHDARAGPYLHLTFSALPTPGQTSRARADASLTIPLPAPAVDNIGLCIDPGSGDRNLLQVFILTHGAQLFELSIPIASAVTHGLNVRSLQRKVEDLGSFLSPAPAWTAGAEQSSGTASAMALVLGQKQLSRGRAAIQCIFVHAKLALIACEDGSLILLKRDGRKAPWQEINLKPTSFLNTLARLIPRASTAPATSRSAGGVASTQLPEPTATFEPTQILALDSFDNEATFALAFAISRDRKLRIWGLTSEQCLHQLELPRKRPDLTSNEAGFGARAIARRALRLRGGADRGGDGGREGSVAASSVNGSATGGGSPVKAPSEYSTATAAFQAGAVFGAAGLSGSADGAGSGGGGVSLPRIRIEEAPEQSPYSLFALVFVPVPATPTQARAESFFIFYGIRLSHANNGGQGSDEIVQSVTPLWSCAAADEGEDEAAGLAAVPALRALKLQSLFEGEGDAQGWTLWTAWNTLAGPELRKTQIPLDINGKIVPTKAQDSTAPSLTQEEVMPPIWTSVSMFPCPSSPASSSSARARFQPLHGPSFQQDLARAVEYESKSIPEFFIDRIFEPGRFDLRNLAKAADWYEDVQRKALRGKELGPDESINGGPVPGPSTTRGDSARCQPTALKARLISVIGSDLRPQRDAATGALVQDEFEGLLIREWIKLVDRAEHEEDAARFVVGFVESVVCADEPVEDPDSGPQTDAQPGALESAWASQKSDPVMIVANNRIGVPIAELPAETLLRIAQQAATEELSLFTSQSGEDYSIDTKESKRFLQPDIALIAAATRNSAVIPLEDMSADDIGSDISSRLERSRLLAGLTALGLSVPRSLASSTASSVIEVLRHSDASGQGRIFNDDIQDAWIASCELHYADALRDLEEELRGERADLDDDAQDDDPEFEQHLAQGRADILEDTSRLVGEWVKSQLFSVDEVVGDEANAVDQRKIMLLEQALWLWLDLMSGPSLSTPVPDEETTLTSPITGTTIGAVLTADGAERSLQARRRLAHALLVVLLSLQRSAFFNPASGDAGLDGEEDDPFALDLADVPRRSDKIIPSLPLLLSTLLSVLQRIEALYNLTTVSARPEADPRKLLAAAEMERKQNLRQLREEEDLVQDADEFEDLSFDRTVTRLGNMTVQPDRHDAVDARPASKPASFRNLFHYAVHKQAIDASVTDITGAAAYARTGGDGESPAAPALLERISNAASGILSFNGLLGLYLPSAVWTAVDDRSAESQDLYSHGQLVGSAVYAASPRFEAPQAQFGRALFNLGFPSAVISYVTVFSEGKNSAVSYLTARALIASGRFEAAEAHIHSVASSLRKLANDLTRAFGQREQRRQARRPQRSPDDWEHAEGSGEEGRVSPPPEEEEEAQAMDEDDEDDESLDPYDEDQKALMQVLPESVTTAIEAHAAIPAVAVELYYRHLVDVLLESDAAGLLIKVCSAAIESNAEVEAVILDEEQAQLYRINPEVEPPTLHPVERLWTHLFSAQLALGRFVDAYATLLRIPLNDLQVRCLRQLVTVMCEQGQSPILLGFGFPGLQSKVERELSFKARNSLLFTYPNYFDILHKFYVFRGDMKNAAASMYQLGQSYAKFHRQGGSPFADPAESFLELSKMQAQSYLAAMNDLALCQPQDAWFPDSSLEPYSIVNDDMFGEVSIDDGTQLDRDPADAAAADQEREPEEEQRFNPMAAKRRRLTTYIPEREFKVERAPIRFVCADDVRREYHLVLARLHLVQFFPEASNPSFVLGPSNAVSLFVGNRQFDAAFDVARELEVDMTPIFQRLTTISVALTESLSRRRAETATTSADDGLLRRLESVYDADENRDEVEVEFLSTSEWAANWDGPAAERAWDYVRIHLEMYDTAESGWRYRQAVLDRCLALGVSVSVPGWLVEWFHRHNTDALMRSYVQFGRVDEALEEGIRLVKDVSNVKGPSSVYVPYSLLDTALLLAEDPEERARRAASPSVLRTRDLAGELRTAVQQRFDALSKAEKNWMRDVDRSERAGVRVDV
ncbi:hypothetical protein OC846_004963 [Tilletia horrida]|uniref:Nuclear pore complex protein Nup160 n=1 Tax=Tilletia horrida TaxID=155126 RepID=A0AAN6JPZ5_9BASI|nr:hypothetical protein OC845_004647 [Tilletia horrida]KAK0547208.1 hypothetical protein OC846_004963 [Tilletia horrida]KAK0563785.1 hypothetical protein OC861_004631 [Tilletia horrida]